MPVVALTVLVVVGPSSTAGLVVPTLIGLVVLVGGVVVFGADAAQREPGRSRSAGGAAGRRAADAARPPPPDRLGQAVLEFRRGSIGLIRARWGS